MDTSRTKPKDFLQAGIQSQSSPCVPARARPSERSAHWSPRGPRCRRARDCSRRSRAAWTALAGCNVCVSTWGAKAKPHLAASSPRPLLPSVALIKRQRGHRRRGSTARSAPSAHLTLLEPSGSPAARAHQRRGAGAGAGEARTRRGVSSAVSSAVPLMALGGGAASAIAGGSGTAARAQAKKTYYCTRAQAWHNTHFRVLVPLEEKDVTFLLIGII